jgi:hypothetical protein
VLAAALFAYLGHVLIAGYGTARYRQGLAEGRAERLPQLLSANRTATQAALEARDRVIAAEAARADQAARLATLIRRSDEEVTRYETSNAGRAGCLDAGRVRAIEAHRTALFPELSPTETSRREPGSVPAEPAPHATGRQPR